MSSGEESKTTISYSMEENGILLPQAGLQGHHHHHHPQWLVQGVGGTGGGVEEGLRGLWVPGR